MSEVFASPTSFRLELEARRLHAAAPPRALADLVPAVVFSRLPQGVDMAVGLFVALEIFPRIMFPGLPPALASLAGLATWALAYAVAPLGRRLGEGVRARFGLGVAATAARFGFGAATAAFAFLPVFADVGPLAVAALAACRLAQGLALGGAADEGPAFRAFVRISPAWGAAARAAPLVLGLAVAAALIGTLSAFTSPADLLAWGWRLPFALAVPLNVVALFAELRLLTTETSATAGGGAMLRLAATQGG